MEKKRLLLVDDVELFLELERSFLSRDSFELHTARSGREALSKAREIGPDLILLDLFMPDLDGETVCREIKRDGRTKDIPVVMITSVSTAGARERCFLAGCDAFVPKPIQREMLLSVIEERLKIAQRRYRRIPARLECAFRLGGRDRTGWIHHISEGGVFLQLEDAPPPGTAIPLSFSLPRRGGLIRVQGVVRWAGRLDKDHDIRGVGLEFIAISPIDRDQIRAYVASKKHILGTART